MSEHRGESNQVDPGHCPACRPSMTKIVESKCRNRTLVCFRSDAVDSPQRANVRTIYFDDWSVARPGKTKSPVTFSSRLPKSALAFSVIAALCIAAFVFLNGF